MRFQLRHRSGKWYWWPGLNRRRLPCRDSALPLSYTSIYDMTAKELANLLLDGVIDPKELSKGTRDEEEEHDMRPAKAKKTALQHLTLVDPHYYTKTEKCLKPKPKGIVIGDQTTIGL